MKSESDDYGEFYMGDGKTMADEANDSVQMLGIVILACILTVIIACGCFWFSATFARLLAFLAHHAKALCLEWRIIP